jgi:hypothetical protein
MPRDQSQEEAMTIALSVSGQTSEPQLEEDEFHMLWLAHRNRRNSGRVQILLSAALQNGWRIVRASPDEQALSLRPPPRDAAVSRSMPSRSIARVSASVRS